MKLESKHSEKERPEVGKVVRNALKGKKAKRRQRGLQTRRHIPPVHPLNSAYCSWVSKGHGVNPIQVDLADIMKSDRKWDDIKVEIRN